jgi:hypothetical protein
VADRRDHGDSAGAGLPDSSRFPIHERAPITDMPEDPNTADVEVIIDSLYALEPEAFTAARDQHAAELRGAGERDAAKRVKALRRPTVAAWAVNQVVRRHPDKVDELLRVTDELGATQRDALTGGQRDLRAVSERRQEQLDQLLTLARQVIDDSGRSSSAHEDDIARTLQASTDPDLGRQVRAGRLTTGLEPVSALEGLTAWFDESGAAGAAARRGRERDRDRARREAENDLATAERNVERARAEVDRLRHALAEAEERLSRLEQERAERKEALDRARRRA